MGLNAVSNRKLARPVAVAAVALFLAMASIAFAAPESASIVSVKGSVKYSQGDSQDWKDAKAGMAVTEGGKIKTGANSEAIIKWKQGHVANVFQLSVVKLDALSSSDKSEKTTLNINDGKVFVKASKLKSVDSQFQVKTPTALAGVRGTEFLVEVSAETSATTFQLLEGKLDIIGEQVQTILQSNTQISILQNMEAPPAPAPMSDQSITELQGFSADIDSQIQKIEPAPQQEPESKQGESGTGSEAANQVQNTVTDTVDNIKTNLESTGILETKPDLPPMPPY